MWVPPNRADPHVTTTLAWLAQSGMPERVLAHPVPTPLLFVDIETTRDRIVEIAMIRLARGLSPWVWHTYVHPGPAAWSRSREYWNTAVHGVTPAMVQGQPQLAQVLHVLDAALTDATVVAHNVSFERRFLELELDRLGSRFARPTLCTLKLARALFPDLDDHKLGTLAAAFDVRNPAPHRALGDTFTTVWVLLALLSRPGGGRPMAARIREATRTADRRPPNPWA